MNQQKREEREDLFDDWNGLKQELHFDEKRYPQYRELEIWWIALGQNIGTEVYGKGDDHLRPVLILKKFGRNFLGIPLTSKKKEYDNPHFFHLNNAGGKESWAMLTQIRFFDADRLFQKPKYGNKVPETIYNELKKEIIKICF